MAGGALLSNAQPGEQFEFIITNEIRVINSWEMKNIQWTWGSLSTTKVKHTKWKTSVKVKQANDSEPKRTQVE